MSTFDRGAHCRRIASSGGRATVEIHGIAHMQEIGKRGFQQAVALGWGLELARKLAPSYQRKFGRPLTLSSACETRARIRAEARRLYGGMRCQNCGASRGQVHHIAIDADRPNQVSVVRILCGHCHIAEHRALRRLHLRFTQGGASQ